MEDALISNMSGDELIRYLHSLSQKQSEYSQLKINLIEELKPIEKARSDKRADIQKVSEQLKQTKIEIASCKYALKAEAQ